ncbi:MAG: redoxin domain-containing protein, partial [Pseudomonadota bacterium]
MKSLTVITALLATVLFFGSHAVRAESPKVGQPAPDFKLPDQNGQIHTLADFRGKWLALYFYPK